MFTNKLVFKMLLFTVLLANVAFGAGKLSISKIILCRYLKVYFTQKQNMLKYHRYKKNETKMKRITDTRSIETRSFHLLFPFSGKNS